MIKVEGVEKSYNGELVLKNVSLTFADGDFVSIMGESGSGKSTLLGIIGGFLSPDAGSVCWNGTDISGLTEKEMSHLRCTEMGFVFQSYGLIPTLNIRDNMLLTATLGKHEGAAAQMELLAERLKLRELYKKYPAQLSGGQCQRAAIVRALVYQPSVLILDEPTGALDSRMEQTVMELLAELNRTLGMTIIQVTHSEKVAAYAGRIIRIRDGEIVL